jgi:hypothetical protein
MVLAPPDHPGGPAVNRAEYLAMLENEPATPNQRGAIMRECDRLGLADRAERLATCAALLDLDALGSTAELTMGQGGKLVNALQSTRDRADLPDMTTAAGPGDGGQGEDGPGDGISAAEAITRIIVMIATAVRDFRSASRPMSAGISRDSPHEEALPAQGRTNSSA